MKHVDLICDQQSEICSVSEICLCMFLHLLQVQAKRRNRLLSNKLRDLVFIKFNSKLSQKREMKNRDPLEDTTYADVVEDEENEWITGVVPVPVVPIEVEDDEPQATTQGHRVTHRRKMSNQLVLLVNLKMMPMNLIKILKQSVF